MNLNDRTKVDLIDSLLDSYNENMVLYRLFGDLCYKERADHFIQTLKRHFSQGSTEPMEYV